MLYEVSPLLKPFFNQVEKSAGIHGFQETVKRLLDYLPLSTSIHTSERVWDLLNDRSVSKLILIPHPHGFEPFSILSILPNFERFFLIGNAGMVAYGEHISKSIIPILINREKTGGLEGNISRWVGWGNHDLAPEVAFERNIAQIDRARNLIGDPDNPATIMICPEGDNWKEESPSWKTGWGDMIVENASPDNAHVIFAKIAPITFDGIRPNIAFDVGGGLSFAELKDSHPDAKRSEMVRIVEAMYHREMDVSDI